MKLRHRRADWGFLFALTVLWGSAFLFTKVAVDTIPSQLVVAGRLAIAALLLVPVSSLASVAILGVFSTALAAVLYFRLIKTAGPAFVSQLNYLIPLWAVLIGMVFLDEHPEAKHLLAMCLILGGVLVSQLEYRCTRGSRGAGE